MTPTEQDKELRRAIVNYRIKCDYYLSDRDAGVISQEVYEAAISSELDTVVQLIAADRKRVALEARIDALEYAKISPRFKIEERIEALKQELESL